MTQRWQWIAAAGILVVALAVPLATDDLAGLTLITIFAVALLALNLVVGWGGQLTLAHAAFMGIGAYAVGLLGMQGWAPSWLGLLVGPLVCGLLAYLIGAAAVRLGAVFLPIVTLAAAEAFRLTAVGWTDVSEGVQSITGIARPVLGPLDLSGDRPFYYACLGVLVATLYALLRARASSFGLALVAAREDEPAAHSVGVDAGAVRTQAFVVAAMVAAFAGGLLVQQRGVLLPAAFGLDLTVQLLAVLVIAGLGTLTGSVLAAAILVAVPAAVPAVRDSWLPLSGLLMAAFLVGWPRGLVGMAQVLWARRETTAEAPVGGIETAAR